LDARPAQKYARIALIGTAHSYRQQKSAASGLSRRFDLAGQDGLL
jgi:hypothetical protein